MTKNERGFSILELLVVVAVVSLIAAMAIPNLKKARQSASSASAVQSLRTLTTAEQMYRQKYQVYGTLSQLAPEGTLDTTLGSGSKGAGSEGRVSLAADRVVASGCDPVVEAGDEDVCFVAIHESYAGKA